MSDPKDTQVVFKIPEDVIKAQVQSAVAQALAANPQELVRACVEMAMQQTKDTYSRTTIWEQMVGQKIRDVAKECFQEWLQEQTPMIKKEVRSRLERRRGDYFDKMLGALVDAMSTGFECHIRVKGE